MSALGSSFENRKARFRQALGKSRSRKARTASVHDIRSDILKATQTATKDLGQCPNRLWAVTKNLPGGLENLPLLFPPDRDFDAFPRTQNDHAECGFEFCEHSQLDFTTVSQRHECGRRLHLCEQLGDHFPSQVLEDAAEKDLCMAWGIDGRTLTTVSQGYMAISHCWSDGTGSGAWPEKGMNRCLWFFFVQIARHLQLSGIWWDTISLPRGKTARAIAINRMHQNYADARVTLVHDCYLRDFAWDDSNPQRAAEMASLAIIMSPWFSRGWTALELANSVRVKIIFKRGKGYVLKDLDNDILLACENQSPSYHIATRAIKDLRKRRVTSLDGLLTVLGPRHTSWTRDMAIIAGLLAGIEIGSTSTQSEIYQNILKNIGWLGHRHLYFNSPKMSKGFDWCPANILDIPLASSDAALRVEDNGTLTGFWKAFRINSIPPTAFALIGIPPMTDLALHSALETPKTHVFLVEPAQLNAHGALIVQVLGSHETFHRVCCRLVGYLPFHPIQHLKNATMIDVEVSFGDTNMVNRLCEDAWSVVRSYRRRDLPSEKGFGLNGGRSSVKQVDIMLRALPRPLHQAHGSLRDRHSERAVKNKIIVARGEGEEVHSEREGNPHLLIPAERMFDRPYPDPNFEHTSTESESIDVSYQHDRGRNLLHLAIWRDDVQLLEYLISQGTDISTGDCCSQQPLHLAAERGNMHILKTLLQADTDYDRRCTSDGQTAFHRAVLGGCVPVIELLKPKSNLNALDSDGQTALHIATSRSCFTVVKLLLDSGAETNVQDNRDRTALWWAACNGDKNITKLLLQHASIHVNASDRWGRTALHVAARHGHTDVARLLMRHPRINASVKDVFGREPIFHATLYGHTALVQLLSDNDSCYPLVQECPWQQRAYRIAERDATAAIDFFLENRSPRWDRSELSSRSTDGPGNENPIEWAVSWMLSEIVEYLLEIGLYPDRKRAEPKFCVTPLQIAAQRGDADTLEFIIATKELDINYQSDFSQNALCRAVKSGNPATLQVLLRSEGINVNMPDYNGDTALELAAKLGDRAMIIQLLADRKCDVNRRGRSATAMTALACAASMGHVGAVEVLLLTDDIEVDLISMGLTPLQHAARNGHSKVVKLLLASTGIDVNYRGMHLKTALMLAADNGHNVVVSLLLDIGNADIDIKAHFTNETALPMGVKKGHDKVITAMLRHLSKTKFRDQKESLEPILLECAQRGILVVKDLLSIEDGLDINLRNNLGQTPLLLACICGHVDFVKELLTCGKFVDINAQDQYMRTPLSYAAERGDEAIATELLAFGDQLDMNLEDVAECTPLFYAAINNHPDIAKRLWKTGKAGFGSITLPILMHVFDPILEYIDNKKICKFWGRDMSKGGASNLERTMINISTPLSELREDVLQPDFVDSVPLDFLSPDMEVFDALLDHIDRRREYEHHSYDLERVNGRVVESLAKLEHALATRLDMLSERPSMWELLKLLRMKELPEGAKD